MALYSVYVRKNADPLGPEKVRLIRSGFSWLAFIFPVVWLLFHRVWRWFLVILAVEIGLALLADIRAVGPGLAQFGVAGVLADPILRVFDANGVQIAQNDDWQNPASALAASADQLAAAALAIAIYEAWVNKRGLVGWVVNIIVSLLGAFFAAQIGGFAVVMLLGPFMREYPGIDISLEVLNRDGVLQRLREGRDDFCIMSMPPQDVPLVDEVFMPNPIVVIAASTDPLTKQKNVSLSEVLQRRFILREAGSGTRMAADPEWQAFLKINAGTFTHQENKIMRPAPFSPGD